MATDSEAKQLDSDRDFNRIFRPTIGLWTCAAMLFIAIMYLEYKRPPDRIDDGGLVFFTRLEEGMEPVPLVESEINYLKIERKNDTLEFRKISGRWEITQPLHWYAHASTVNQVVRSLCNNRYKRWYPEADIDPKQMGLDSPRLTISMTDRDGNTYQVKVGSKTDDEDDTVYIFRADRKRAYIVDDAIARCERTALERILPKKTVDFDQNDLKTVKVYAYNEVYELNRDKVLERWRLAWAKNIRGDEQLTDRLIKSLTPSYKTMHDEKPDNLEQYGLDSPSFRVSFMFDSREPLELQIGSSPLGGAGNFVYAKNSVYEPVFLLDAEFLDLLKLDADKLRDPVYIQKPKGDYLVGRLDIENMETDEYIVVAFNVESGGFQIQKMGTLSTRYIERPKNLGSNVQVHPESHLKFQNQFFDVRGAEYYEATEFNLKKYGFKGKYISVQADIVEIIDDRFGDTETINLRIATNDKGTVYMWRVDDPYIIKATPGNELYEVVSNIDNFRITYIWDIPVTHDIVIIEIAGPEDSYTYRKVSAVGWRLQGMELGIEPMFNFSGGQGKDLVDARDQIRKLIPYQTIRKKGDVDDQALEKYGLKNPILRLKVGYFPKKSTGNDRLQWHEMWVGDRDETDGDSYASGDLGQSIVKVDGTFIYHLIYKLRKLAKGMDAEAKRTNDSNQIAVKKFLRGLHKEMEVIKKDNASPDADNDGIHEYCTIKQLGELSTVLPTEDLNFIIDGVFYFKGYFFHLFLPSEDGGTIDDDEKNYAVIAWPEIHGVSGTKVFALLNTGDIYSFPNNETRLLNRLDDFGEDIQLKTLFPNGKHGAANLNHAMFKIEK